VRKDSPLGTLTVAAVLSLVCSIAVSGAAVLLKPAQERNKALALKKEVIRVAGLLEPGVDVATLFERRVQTRLVDLAKGAYVTDVDPDTYDYREAARNSNASEAVPPEQDIARIKRRADYAPVYLVHAGERLETVILPLHGYGLWSTMYGLLALAADGRTVRGVTFYEHGETAGLGAEIENPRWQALWKDKLATDESGAVRFRLVKGGVKHSDPTAPYSVDAISGATLTSDGVTNLIRYWLSDQGYGPYLARLRGQEGKS
jgi:Na+-transporting NADH:ubiquinone oxidoreductase subunit C